MINVYTRAIVNVLESQWTLLYEESTKIILAEPMQAAGSYTVADVLAVADTKEELDQYIVDNNLITRPLEEYPNE